MMNMLKGSHLSWGMTNVKPNKKTPLNAEFQFFSKFSNAQIWVLAGSISVSNYVSMAFKGARSALKAHFSLFYH